MIEEIKAHVLVFRAVVSGKTHPGVIRIKKPFKSDFANFLVFNGITFTPGTLTVEINDEHATIHCLNIMRSRNAGVKFVEALRGAFT